MPNAERKPGYYRVKYNGEWVIAGFSELYWKMIGGNPFIIRNDFDFDAIDETPIDPNPLSPDDNLINQLKSSEIF